jgi:hypothetical protein
MPGLWAGPPGPVVEVSAGSRPELDQDSADATEGEDAKNYACRQQSDAGYEVCTDHYRRLPCRPALPSTGSCVEHPAAECQQSACSQGTGESWLGSR